MQPETKRPPRQAAPGLSFARRNSSTGKNITPAPVRAFRQELWIILNAAHRMAAGYGLAWSDYDRLHEAHQHVLRVLEVVND